ncbi:unnamed protein product [Dimorphilus gyrociliatus]|uniref:G-protein coupled receptors family 1 profile domain-containing protein n=1 Tax=Dimorphilus gyrociliatus TaxID=2664684 RepID=A0A7I8VV23_9ANNE|nr:unnamed protein product [Dimorphilus gyrociliatus]
MEKLLCKALGVLLTRRGQLANLSLLNLFEQNFVKSCRNSSVIEEETTGNENENPVWNSKIFVIPIVFGLIVLIGAIGNVLVFVAVWKRALRTTTNFFIVNLAVADLLFLLFCAPFHAVIYTDQAWFFGEIACKLVHLLQYSSMLASAWTLVAMSADRYFSLMKRFKVIYDISRSNAASFIN